LGVAVAQAKNKRMSRLYRCNECGQVTPHTSLADGAWGDRCCPACRSPNVTRERARFEHWYAIFFLYKVY
jgi:hypothetical protein